MDFLLLETQPGSRCCSADGEKRPGQGQMELDSSATRACTLLLSASLAICGLAVAPGLRVSMPVPVGRLHSGYKTPRFCSDRRRAGPLGWCSLFVSFCEK